MIAVDTSAIIATALDEDGAEAFKRVFATEPMILLGWPTAFEAREVLALKGFGHAGQIMDEILRAPNVTPVAFERRHYQAADDGFARYGKAIGHPAALDFGDCLAYAIARIAGAALLFKGAGFGHTDLRCHEASIREGEGA